MKYIVQILIPLFFLFVSCSSKEGGNKSSSHKKQEELIKSLEEAKAYGTIFPIGCIDNDKFKFLYSPEKMEEVCNALFDIFDLSFDTIEFISGNIEILENYNNIKYYALTAKYNINGRISYGAIGLSFTQDNILYLHTGYQVHLCLSMTCNCPMENMTPMQGHNCICETPPGDCNSDLTIFEVFTQAATDFLKSNSPLICAKATPLNK